MCSKTGNRETQFHHQFGGLDTFLNTKLYIYIYIYIYSLQNVNKLHILRLTIPTNYYTILDINIPVSPQYVLLISYKDLAYMRPQTKPEYFMHDLQSFFLF